MQRIKNLLHRIHYIFIFRLKSKLRRSINSALNFSRPPSFPYITGDGFRSIADHVFDEISSITVSHVINGDIIFVRSDFLLKFFKEIHPLIEARYILITGNSDQNIKVEHMSFIDAKIIHMFAQNVIVSHEKVTPIPIGLQLRKYDPKNTNVLLIKEYQKNNIKSASLYYSFSPETNPIRTTAIDHLTKNLFSKGNLGLIDKKIYFEQMSQCMFNASPEGNGVDCHRTWESMYVKSIPIVTKTISTQYWYDKGLPLYQIDSWKDIDMISDKSLTEIYLEMKGRFNSPLLYMEYWIQKILSQKDF